MGPGQMDNKMVWLFALGGGLAGGLLGFVSAWAGLGVLGAGAFLGTFMTKASKGAGIGAGIVGTLIYVAVVAVGVMMAASSAADEMAANASEAEAAVGGAVMGGLGLIGAILASIVYFIGGIVVTPVAAIAGASMRPSA